VFARDGDPHPRQFTYPSLPTYFDTALVLAARASGRLRLDGSLADYVKALPLGRGLAVAFGVATIAACFTLALQAFGSRAAALAAALVTATNPLHALYSRFVTVDGIATFFVTLGLLFAVRAGQFRRRRDFVLGGFCAGLTASCKFNLGIVGLSLLPAAATGLGGSSPDERRRRLGDLAVAGLVAFLAFALTSPYCVLRYAADGSLERRIEVPARAVTSLCFGGSDGRDLYVVTADNTESSERKGTVFRARSEIAGAPVAPARV